MEMLQAEEEITSNKNSTELIELRGLAPGGYTLLLRDAQGSVLGALPLIKR